LFPGATPLLLALVGLLFGIEHTQTAGRVLPVSTSGYRAPAWVTVTLTILAMLHGAAAIVALVMRRVTIDLWVVPLRLGNITNCSCARRSSWRWSSRFRHRRARAPWRSCGHAVSSCWR
jgi:hypothetical protein